MGDTADQPFVAVVYATAGVQASVAVPLEPGLTAQGAVERSGLADRFPEIRGRPLVVGVFGVRVPLDQVLAAGDRVEICRPLLRDPRERRRAQAVKKPARD
jgi:putative ubiquitin-RnfH superfamily antitoxin RatB of RatAB toxin-antitoxin module